MRIVKMLIVSLAITGFATRDMAVAQAAGWEPRKPVELIAASGPGGGWDMLLRIVQKTMQEEKIVSKKMLVVNKPGAGGATGWTYLKNKKGQGEFLAATSTMIMLNNLLGNSDLTYKDFTVVANLQSEWIAVAVGKDSPYKSGKDLFEAIKANPDTITVGVGPGLGNNDHISFLMLAREYGVNPQSIKFVVYPRAAAEQIPALMGGHIQVVTIGLAEVLEQHKGGNVRIIGISADKRIDILPDVAPWAEQGVNVVFPHWRGIIAAPGLSPEQAGFWQDAFAKMVKTKTWKEELDKLGWYPYYQNSDEHTKDLARQTEQYRVLMKSVGLIK